MASGSHRERPITVWAARGGHGATTVASVLALLLHTSVETREPWVVRSILGVDAPERRSDRPPIRDAGVVGVSETTVGVNLVVLRGPSIVGLQTLHSARVPFDGLVLVREPWRVASAADVESVLGVTLAAEVPFSERVSRLADAGFLGARIEKLEEFQALRRWAERLKSDVAA